jgi:hypothetical protein
LRAGAAYGVPLPTTGVDLAGMQRQREEQRQTRLLAGAQFAGYLQQRAATRATRAGFGQIAESLRQRPAEPVSAGVPSVPTAPEPEGPGIRRTIVTRRFGVPEAGPSEAGPRPAWAGGTATPMPSRSRPMPTPTFTPETEADIERLQRKYGIVG